MIYTNALFAYDNRWASLTDSAVYTNDAKVGDAVGYVSSSVSSTGVDGHLTFYTAVRDGDEEQQLLSNNTAVWFSPSSQWLNAGSISATSVFQLVNSVDWDAQGSGVYGDNRYTISASDRSVSGDNLFDLYGTGGYGGESVLEW